MGVLHLHLQEQPGGLQVHDVRREQGDLHQEVQDQPRPPRGPGPAGPPAAAAAEAARGSRRVLGLGRGRDRRHLGRGRHSSCGGRGGRGRRGAEQLQLEQEEEQLPETAEAADAEAEVSAGEHRPEQRHGARHHGGRRDGADHRVQAAEGGRGAAVPGGLQQQGASQ